MDLREWTAINSKLAMRRGSSNSRHLYARFRRLLEMVKPVSGVFTRACLLVDQGKGADDLEPMIHPRASS